jgi:hypothetical protein
VFFSPSAEMRVEQDRRQHPRSKISCPVTIQTDQGPIEGELRNICLGGLLIHSETLPDLGEPFKIDIQIPDSVVSISATVRAIRVHIQSGDDNPTTYRIAVHLVGDSEELSGILSQLMDM